ncbi:MAG: hypothetical protein H6954_09085 [Chromatiaceae bacterium]|nr:hypothetical protein [Chromatiaceae bacterium]
MTHVIVRIVIWALIIGAAYLYFGPKGLDSSGGDGMFENASPMYLPPPRSPRLVELEGLAEQGSLTSGQTAELQSLQQQRLSGFWAGSGQTVEAALAEVPVQRRVRLAEILQQRGLTPDEMAAFFIVLNRDHRTLLDDRD